MKPATPLSSLENASNTAEAPLSRQALEAAARNIHLPARGWPKAAAAIAALGGLALLGPFTLGLWVWAQAGLALQQAGPFMALASLGSVIGAMLGLLAACVYQPSLLAQSLSADLLKRTAAQDGDRLRLDIGKAHRFMARLQMLKRPGLAAAALGSLASICLIAGLAASWMQWPGLEALRYTPASAGLALLPALLSLLVAALLGMTAMIAGLAPDIRRRMAVGLARLRARDDALARAA